MSSNVIIFPGRRSRKVPTNLDQLHQHQKNITDQHIEYVLWMMEESLYDAFNAYSGLDSDQRNLQKDFHLVRESISSLVKKGFDQFHPLQLHSDKLYSMDKDGFITEKYDKFVLSKPQPMKRTTTKATPAKTKTTTRKKTK